MLMVFTGLFLLLFIVVIGILMLRLLYLPQQMVSQEDKAKYEVVATLCVLAMFSPGNFFWIAALGKLLALPWQSTTSECRISSIAFRD